MALHKEVLVKYSQNMTELSLPVLRHQRYTKSVTEEIRLLGGLVRVCFGH